MINRAIIKTIPMSGTAVDAAAVFELRCEARALLWRLGEFELQDAVDVLQDSALADGLVAAITQDTVQAIMSRAFGAVR